MRKAYAAAAILLLLLVIALLRTCGAGKGAGRERGLIIPPGKHAEKQGPEALRMPSTAKKEKKAGSAARTAKTALAVMTDYSGAVMWSLTLSGGAETSAEHAEALRDGTSLVLCREAGEAGQSDTFFTAIIDVKGRILSVTDIGPGAAEEGRAVFETHDGQATFGTIQQAGDGKFSVFVAKAAGDTRRGYRQVKTFGADGLEWPEESVETGEGYYMSIGMEDNAPPGSAGVVVSRRDDEGVYIWSRKYSRGNLDRLYSITDIGGGRCLLAGMAGDTSEMASYACALILDADGNTVMAKEWDGRGYNAAFASAASVSGKGFVLAGASSDGAYGSYDMLLISSGPEGEGGFAKKIGGRYNDAAFSVADTGKGYLLAGMTEIMIQDAKSKIQNQAAD